MADTTDTTSAPITSIAPSKPRWSIWGFYKQAWQLTWHNKKLWILGAAVMVLSGSSNFNSSSNGDDRRERTQRLQNSQLGAPTTQLPVPSTTTTNDAMYEYQRSQLDSFNNPEKSLEETTIPDPKDDPFVSALIEAWGGVSFMTRVILVMEMILGVIALFAFFIISCSWAIAALMTGVLQASKNKLGSIAEVAQESFAYIRPMVWLSTIPMLVFMLLIIGFFIVVAIVFALLANVMPLLSVLWMIGIVIFSVYAALRFGAAITWAQRFIVNDHLSGRQAFDMGNKVGSKSYWKVLRLGFLNLIVLILSFVIVFAVPFRLIMLAAARNSATVQFTDYMPATVAFLIAIPISGLVQSIFQVFNFATWQFGFETVGHLATEERES